MSDRDKPEYDPEYCGDLNDYWASSASYFEQRAKRIANSEAKMGQVRNRQDWLKALSIYLADDDEHIIDRLREIATEWNGSDKERKFMLNILDNVQDLRTHY